MKKITQKIMIFFKKKFTNFDSSIREFSLHTNKTKYAKT